MSPWTQKMSQSDWDFRDIQAILGSKVWALAGHFWCTYTFWRKRCEILLKLSVDNLMYYLYNIYETSIMILLTFVE